MSFMSTLRAITGACAIAFGSAAAATPVATFDILGDYGILASPDVPFTTFTASGTFSGELFDADPDVFEIYRFSALASIDDVPLLGGFFDAPGFEIALLLSELLGPDGPPEVGLLIDYFVENTGAEIPLPIGDGVLFSFMYSDLELTETTVDGSFMLSITDDAFLPEVVAFGSFGSFEVNLAIDVAPIPLPAGLPLLAGGVGLLALIRKRKAKTS